MIEGIRLNENILNRCYQPISHIGFKTNNKNQEDDFAAWQLPNPLGEGLGSTTSSGPCQESFLLIKGWRSEMCVCVCVFFAGRVGR